MFSFVVVVVKVFSELLAKRIEVFERIVLVKLLLDRSVESLDLAVLRGLPRINEVVRNTEDGTIQIKRMEARVSRIRALFVTRVVIGEGRMIVGLYTGYGKG